MGNESRGSNFMGRRFIAFIINALTGTLFAGSSFFILYLLITFFSPQFAATAFAFLAAAVLAILAAAVVFALFRGPKPSLPGYREQGLAIVDGQGNPIGFKTAFLRNILYILSAMPLFIGLIWCIFDKNGRGWPDIVLDTRIISSREESSEDERHWTQKAAFQISLVLNIVLILVLVQVFFRVASRTIFFYSSIILFIIAFLEMLMSIILRFIGRKGGKKIRGDYGFGNALACMFIALFIFSAFPSGPSNTAILARERCEREMLQLAGDIERFYENFGRLPDSLDELIEEDLVNILPEPFHCPGKEYIYKIDRKRSGDRFMILHPCPEKMMKETGFLGAPKRCTELLFIQDRGIIVNCGSEMPGK